MPDTLMRRPALSTRITSYIALWNMAETMAPAALDKLFGEGHGHAILGHIQSINSRFDTVESVLKLHRQQPWVAGFLDILPRLRDCCSYRNRLAHGLYVEKEDESGVLLMGNFFDSRRAFRQEEITEESVWAEYRKLEQVLLAIVEAVKH